METPSGRSQAAKTAPERPLPGPADLICRLRRVAAAVDAILADREMLRQIWMPSFATS
jgi:hypothetical protein